MKEVKGKDKKQEKKTTRVLAIGDIHGDTKKVKQLVEKAKKEQIDLVILAGDITFAERSVDNIVGPFVKANKKVLLIPGNHESVATVDFLANLYGATNLHGYSFITDNKHLAIFGAGGANVGPFHTSEKEVYNLLKRSHEKIKGIDKKIMVTHMHPSGTIMEKMTKFVPASKAVRKAIETFKPDVALFGHSHEAAGLEEKIGKTRVIDVARKEVIFEI